VSLPAFAAAALCCGGSAAVQQSIDIDIFYSPGPQQQTRRTLLQPANRTDRRTDAQMEKRTDTVPLYKSRFIYYARIANEAVVYRRLRAGTSLYRHRRL